MIKCEFINVEYVSRVREASMSGLEEVTSLIVQKSPNLIQPPV